METKYSKINHICLLILTVITVTFFLEYMKAVLLPFVISIFIYATLTPIVKWGTITCKLPRFISLIFTVIFFILTFFLLTLFISNSIGGFISGASSYQAKLLLFFESSLKQAANYGFEFDHGNILQELQKLPILSIVKKFSGGIVAIFNNAILIGIFTLFLLGGEKLTISTNSLVEEIKKKISRYVVTKLMTSLGTAILVGGLLMACDVELAFMFAILTFLFNFIPSIGSLVATILPIPILILQFGVDWHLYVVIGISGFIQFTIGNILEPKMMGESMDLHPVTILIFLMFWGSIWGVTGMFLAVPITAILKIVFEKIGTTKRFSELLAGRL